MTAIAEAVPFAEYQAYVKAYRVAASRGVPRERVRAAFSHLTLSDQLLDQLGAAINTGHSMFVYGPPGNGKTVISQAIRNVLDGEIAIPRAIDVNGSIITVFDPAVHQPVDPQETDESGWVRCHQPMVVAGGELTLDSLELAWDETTGTYRAPVQMLANGGVLVIDDFGRQRCSARDLLNRWIAPLENRVDYLTLQTGQQLELPLSLMVVFATNLELSALVDEAFLRRIHRKLFVESPTAREFRDIFKGCCERQDVPYDDALVDDLIEGYYRPRGIALRGCQPRDLIAGALALAEHLGEPRRLTAELLQSACAGYFVDDAEPAPRYA